MLNGTITESEIEAVEMLRSKGACLESLALTQELLNRDLDDANRMRLLFNMLYCSAPLELEETTNQVIVELEKLPQPEMTRIFIDEILANSAIDLGRAQQALPIIESNLKSPFMKRRDFRIHKYDHLAYKGKALSRLSRWDDALVCLSEADNMYSNEEKIPDEDTRRHVRWMRTQILFDKALCMMWLKKFDEAYELAAQVGGRTEGDMKTAAIHYMASCKLNLGRWVDALKLYAAVQERLPCCSIDSDDIQKEVGLCMDALSKNQDIQ